MISPIQNRLRAVFCGHEKTRRSGLVCIAKRHVSWNECWSVISSKSWFGPMGITFLVDFHPRLSMHFFSKAGISPSLISSGLSRPRPTMPILFLAYLYHGLLRHQETLLSGCLALVLVPRKIGTRRTSFRPCVIVLAVLLVRLSLLVCTAGQKANGHCGKDCVLVHC